MLSGKSRQLSNRLVPTTLWLMRVDCCRRRDLPGPADYGDFDATSNLNRDGVFRLNVGVSRQTFRALFPSDEAHDYAELDVLMPHPVYATQSWISVLNPSDQRFAEVKPLLAEAYGLAVRRVA